MSTVLAKYRHPELVSGSIEPPSPKRAGSLPVAAGPVETEGPAQNDRWTLKQVQGDEVRG
jgi:hypothetical protein